ncbi:hypothetical protein [Roseiconus lacunae]|uniref:Uncharacterized protein n=1 Tax=Roseiconus lacunae TaxID=2605694 RepID=A0ABT7PHL3_9BACT|nr:hypothetical protein [Roseiconus lacunae]MDM4015989.1 hypothetical protein [Roseiconus lacunae]
MNCSECGARMIAIDSGMVCERGCGRIMPRPGWSLSGIIPPGSAVALGDGVDGVVVEVVISASARVEYVVAHWKDGERYTTRLDDFEVGTPAEIIEPLTLSATKEADA